MTSVKKNVKQLSWRKRILFSFFLCSFSLFIMELCFRFFLFFYVGPKVILYGLNSKSLDKNIHKVWIKENCVGDYLTYSPNEVKIGHDKNDKTYAIHINSRGFRGKEFNDEKKRGTRRIVTLGASSTFGYKCRDNETYPYYFQEILNSQYNCINSFEVINLGIPHLKSKQILSLFLDLAVKLNPDIVIFYEGANDCSLKELSVFSRLNNELRKRSLLFRYINVLIIRHYTRFREKDIQILARDKSKTFLKNLSLIHQECKERRILFVVANQQVSSSFLIKKLNKKITYQEEAKMIRTKLSEYGEIKFTQTRFLIHNALMKNLEEWALSNNILFVDIIKALNQNRDDLMDWVHLTPRGNLIVAKAFAEKIQALFCSENPGFPK